MRGLHTLTALILGLTNSVTALIGYGISMYDPNCAFACRAQFASAVLSCSTDDHHVGGHGHGTGPTSPACRASNEPWLTTLAYCINSTCIGVAPWKLEKYWVNSCTGDKEVPPIWTYEATVAKLKQSGSPTQGLDLKAEMSVLNFTALYDEETWEEYRGTLFHFENAETMHSRYGIILLVVGFGVPIFVTILGYLPYMSTVIARMNPRLIYPSTIGTYHVRPLPFLLGNAPTMGQAFYITPFFILNIVFMSIGYRFYQPNKYFSTHWEETIGYIAARTGVLGFALMPLVILFSGRNNILLWLTNWSHATYMLLHRWVARIFVLQVILHSITELLLYQRKGELATEQTQPYWIWGIVATLAVVLMAVLSGLYFRRLSYEVFLIGHVILAVFVIAGSWYHVELLFHRKWGYEFWIYAACAVWFSDRAIRILRVLKNGVRRSEVTDAGGGIVRVDIKGVRWNAQPGRHTYAYFPTLKPLRPWENHPFSVVPTALLKPGVITSKTPKRSEQVSLDNAQPSATDAEKHGVSWNLQAVQPDETHGTTTAGITLYVRKSAGLTRLLNSHSALPTLLDGPYLNASTSNVLETDRLLLIAGGIGITGVLSFVSHHTSVKLAWSVKSGMEAVVMDLQGALAGVREKEVRVGTRLDVASLLDEEASIGWEKIGVVVCGPGSMCDEVRDGVAKRGREGGALWTLNVEAFSW